MRTSEIQTDLYADLYADFRKIISENKKKGIFQTRLQICEQLSRSTAPRFYVSLNYAKRIINSMRRGSLRARNKRYALHHELYTRWLKSERTPAALAEILRQPAPSYYLGVSQINHILYKAAHL